MRGKDRIQSLNRRIRELETTIDWWKNKWEDSQFEVTQLTATLAAQKKANLIETTRRNKEIMDEAIAKANAEFTDQRVKDIEARTMKEARRKMIYALGRVWAEDLIGVRVSDKGPSNALAVMDRIFELFEAAPDERELLMESFLNRTSRRNLKFHLNQTNDINRQIYTGNSKSIAVKRGTE